MYIRFMHTYVHIDLWMYRLCMEVSTYVRIYVRTYILPMPGAGEAQFSPPLFTVGIGS